MRLAEERVYDYTKPLSSRQLRDGPQTIYQAIEGILHPFDFKQKPSFLALWDFVLNGTGTAESIKDHLEAIKSVSLNNKLKRLILPQIQTLSKYNGIVKHILNLGKEFSSLFDEVDLTSVETIHRTAIKKREEANKASLDIFLKDQTFEQDEEGLIQTFYSCVSRLSNPILRNTYFNRFLTQLTTTMKAPAPIRLTNLFIQFYDRLVNSELVNKVDPVVSKWLIENPIPFFSHSLKHLPMQLGPYSHFQKHEFVLDSWQIEALEAMRSGQNVLLCTSTSSGKTLISSDAINTYTNVLYVVPEKPLAEQLASILVATLDDNERQKGVHQRNVRLELNEKQLMPYRRFPKKKDNIIVGMPKRISELLYSIERPNCIVMDEFHTISDPVSGPYLQLILYYAAFHKIPVVCLSATIPNFEEVKTWLQSILQGPLFAVHMTRRYFNQRRLIPRVSADHKISLVTLNPLEHLRMTTLQSPVFHHPGLVPGEALRLYEKVATFPRLDETVPRIPTLDDVEQVEKSLFQHVKSQPPSVLGDIVTEEPIHSDQLTLYQIVTTLRSINDSHKPLLMFKMDSLECLTFYTKIIKLLQEENELVYGNFQDDQPIIEQYLQEIEALRAQEDGQGKKAEEHATKRKREIETTFKTKYQPKLERFYKEYQAPIPDPKAIEAFNKAYGANLTYEYIVARRAEHVAEELLQTHDTIGLRTNYTIHDKIKISTYSNGSVMKDIRKTIMGELAFQRQQTGPFVPMKTHGPEFDCFDDIKETRTLRTGETDIRRLGGPWPTERPELIDTEYSYTMDYDHPLLVGIECGILFNNALLNPAFIYMCQLLISKHPLVVISDKTYATGVNFPFRTVWIQGSLKGSPPEDVPNALVWQATGRAGRRGLFRMAMIIFSGIQIANVLFPEFHPVKPNSEAAMALLLASVPKDLVAFIKTGERPAPVAKTIKIANSSTNSVATLESKEEEGSTRTLTLDVNAMATCDSWEDYMDSIGE